MKATLTHFLGQISVSTQDPEIPSTLVKVEFSTQARHVGGESILSDIFQRELQDSIGAFGHKACSFDEATNSLMATPLNLHHALFKLEGFNVTDISPAPAIEPIPSNAKS